MTSTSQLKQEISQQPQALERLIQFYSTSEGYERLAAVPALPPLLIGMGASFHSALIGAHYLYRLKQPALALEATDTLHGERSEIDRAELLVYISQSGASGEVKPLLERLPPDAHLTALTNDENSPLARQAQVLLPLLAGDEHTVATKTYINSIALLWLLVQRWNAELDTQVFDRLKFEVDYMRALLAQAQTIAGLWRDHLGQAQTLVFIGTGLHAITASQSAMMVMEWLKIPALSASMGAFRHGPIEIVQPGVGIVIFTAPGSSYASAQRLATELQGYGASVLLVEHGYTRLPDVPSVTDTQARDVSMSPLVDVLPVQFFIEAMAHERGIVPGFRHITKIVSMI